MAEIRRLLIVKLSSLGDLFHALPAVRALKAGTGAEIDWVVQKEYAGLASCFADVSRVLAFPRRTFFREGWRFLRDLRASRYDLVVDLQGLMKSAFVARMAGGRRILGPSFCREGSRWLYDDVAGPRDKNRHAVDECLDAARKLNLPVGPAVFPVRFPARSLTEAKPRIAVLPLSRQASKNWPLDCFKEAAAGLAQELKASLFLFGTAGDAAACDAIAAAVPRGSGGTALNLAGRTSLVEMGSWLGGMDLVIANDSGPIHMAAALGVPAVALFGPTDPVRTGPYGGNHVVLTADGVECRPCFRRDCDRKRLDCMCGIPPRAVLDAAARIIGRTRA